MNKWVDLIVNVNQIITYNMKTNCKLIMIGGLKVWIQNRCRFLKIINGVQLLISINKEWSYGVQDELGNQKQLLGKEILKNLNK